MKEIDALLNQIERNCGAGGTTDLMQQALRKLAEEVEALGQWKQRAEARREQLAQLAAARRGDDTPAEPPPKQEREQYRTDPSTLSDGDRLYPPQPQQPERAANAPVEPVPNQECAGSVGMTLDFNAWWEKREAELMDLDPEEIAECAFMAGISAQQQSPMTWRDAVAEIEFQIELYSGKVVASGHPDADALKDRYFNGIATGLGWARSIVIKKVHLPPLPKEAK